MSEESRFIKAYHNEEIDRDRRKVTTAVVVLWIVTALALAVALLLFFGTSDAEGLAIGTLVAAAIYGACALAIQLKQSTAATTVAAVLVGLNLLGAFLSFNPIAIGINVGFLVVLIQAHRALHSIKMRVALEEQENPLVAYYHALVPLVVAVMKADGKIDPREIAEFDSLCDKMHVSEMERKLLMDKAMRSDEPISVLVPRFLKAAQDLGVEDPAGHLIEGLFVMAAADRQLQPAEKQVLRKVAVTARYDEQKLEQRMNALEESMKTMGRAEACQVLGLSEQATADQVETAYQNLMAAANPADYLHLGEAVAQKVAERREQLTRARAVLLGQPA